jgi:hypothetical protein
VIRDGVETEIHWPRCSWATRWWSAGRTILPTASYSDGGSHVDESMLTGEPIPSPSRAATE